MPSFRCRMEVPPPCAACARFTNAKRIINHTRVTSRDLSKRHSCNIPIRIICATCPGTDPPPVISSWASRLKATESPRARQGLGMLCNAALSFSMMATAFFGEGLKKFSTGTSWLLAASFFLRKAQSRDPLGLCPSGFPRLARVLVRLDAPPLCGIPCPCPPPSRPSTRPVPSACRRSTVHCPRGWPCSHGSRRASKGSPRNPTRFRIRRPALRTRPANHSPRSPVVPCPAAAVLPFRSHAAR